MRGGVLTMFSTGQNGGILARTSPLATSFGDALTSVQADVFVVTTHGGLDVAQYTGPTQCAFAMLHVTGIGAVEDVLQIRELAQVAMVLDTLSTLAMWTAIQFARLGLGCVRQLALVTMKSILTFAIEDTEQYTE
mmetsp:Transcript_6505/g.14796  ORF Transcript_6505/g.14796 Transcript_6505/m.14796 type:complete len:135 (+) Transcript_6505:1733-2137(+)